MTRSNRWLLLAILLAAALLAAVGIRACSGPP